VVRTTITELIRLISDGIGTRYLDSEYKFSGPSGMAGFFSIHSCGTEEGGLDTGG